ncbi:MAG: ABC transporter ATP-binding protein [Clostridiales bacterium]|nr:ABC transporter ATP-binding protein [Clostridiales bacterium]
MKALCVENLVKRYPTFDLNVSFSVEEGHVCGLIGANGAGKSTTLKAILGLISSSGSVEIFGVPLREEERRAKELVCYTGGGFRYYPRKTLGEIACAVSAFYPNWSKSAFQAYLKKFSLDERKRVAELSEGMKVKFSLALSLSHGARLLILDEPTSGLDPLSREEFADLILELVKTEKVSVLFSTHITSDLVRLADDIVYIADGRVLADEPLSALTEKYSLAEFASEPTEREGLIGLKPTKSGYRALTERGTAVAEATVSEPTLDDIMIHLEYDKRK